MIVSYLITMEPHEADQVNAGAFANNRTITEHIHALLLGNGGSQSNGGPPSMTQQVMPSEWGAVAVKRALEKNPGEEFLLEDLFTDAEWKLIPSHSLFGREFKKALEENHPGEARLDRKNTQNKAVYLRT